ncbi:hypothetical protein BGI09_03210 [Snodgrassella alvi]|nr:hypothetical protein BGI09_03210 [Snodgrassella alvi]
MDAGVNVSPLIDSQAVAKLLNILKMPSLKALNSYRFGCNVGVWEKSYINKSYYQKNNRSFSELLKQFRKKNKFSVIQ